MLNVIIYILSISLQISGALLLVSTACSTKRSDVIKEYVSKNIVEKHGGNNGELNYNKEAL